MTSTKTAFVTGGTGFIGERLVRALLAEGWDVHTIRRNGSAGHATFDPAVAVHALGDSLAEIGPLIESVKPDVVFHLAGIVGGHRDAGLIDLVQSNVVLSAVVAEACTKTQATMVYTTSSHKHFEGQEGSPASLYGATKQAQVDMIRYFVEVQGLEAREVLLFNVYGPEDGHKRLISLLFDGAESGRPVYLSSGEQLVDLTHIDDAVAALLAVANSREPVERVVLRSGQLISIRGLAALIEDITGRTIDARWGSRPDPPREMTSEWHIPSDNVDLGSRISLRDGLTALWARRQETS